MHGYKGLNKALLRRAMAEQYGHRVLRKRAGFVLSKYAAVTCSRDAAGITCTHNGSVGRPVILPVTHRVTGAKSCGQDRLTRISWVGRRV